MAENNNNKPQVRVSFLMMVMSWDLMGILSTQKPESWYKR